MNQDTKDPKTVNSDSSDASVEILQLGVWRVFLSKEGGTFFDVKARYIKWKTLFSIARRLTIDFFILAPVLFPLLCLATLFQRVSGVILWHLFNRCLFVIEVGLTRGQFDTAAVIHAVMARAVFAAMDAVISCWSREAELIVQTRIVQHFEGIVFEWKATADLRVREADAKNERDLIPAHNVWYAYRDLLVAVGRLLSLFSQILYIGTLASTNVEALIYAILFLLKPFTKDIFQRSLWDKLWIAQSSESNFNRMEGLKSIVSKGEYKQEININGNIVKYLIQEYRKARNSLGDASASYPAAQYSKGERIDLAVVSALLGDLHMYYCFASTILYPAKFTLSKLAMLAKAGDRITYELDTFVEDFNAAESGLASVKPVYDLVHTANTRMGGNLDIKSELGLSLAMKNVSFSYPNKESDGNALRDVSFTIKPGQLVVIVGTNGSGKSTILKLLTGLHDCTSGQVTINGRDIADYKLESLRSATAILTQDHHTFPLSLSENIGIGNPQAVANMRLIRESARKGGAEEFISSRANQYSTILDPMAAKLTGNLFYDTDDTALNKIYKAFEKKTEISGGQRQRIAASRTFMRLTTGKVKLIVADEPSSNLDPQGESDLFKNLIHERQGKTMIVVTHRLGLLTKEADLILCMKDGRIVEQGTHKELIAPRDNGDPGEYFKLYEIQAQAFN